MHRPTNPPNRLNTLPPELIRRIAYHTHPRTVAKLRLLSQTTTQAISERDLKSIITLSNPETLRQIAYYTPAETVSTLRTAWEQT
ncbi:hypothetical protein HK097_001447 [Rhizophlyctis rosea]|uniref:F-box domain-containing protein n=1 Tax=Rhizophlyctis rosea TaxID=64517 RepID=A0AAD5SG43_9FUNG|nr:hypothetical protein HK097_001447 [Rhizophlyctis rosea]